MVDGLYFPQGHAEIAAELVEPVAQPAYVALQVDYPKLAKLGSAHVVAAAVVVQPEPAGHKVHIPPVVEYYPELQALGEDFKSLIDPTVMAVQVP